MAEQGQPGQEQQGDAPERSVRFSTPLPSDSTSSTQRPTLDERTESSLPPHLQPSITDVPVTPGIDLPTYKSADSSRSSAKNTSDSPADYFHSAPLKEVAASPDPIDDNMTTATDAAGTGSSESGHDILRRLSQSARGRRESLSEIQAANPTLALSGNVISATFNMSYSLKYRKGADWVCYMTIPE